MRPGEGLEVFFRPSSIAVVGASKKEGSLGYAIMKNLLESFKGRIYPVNPKYDEILGIKAYPSIRDLPEAPDLAVITIRADLAVRAAEEAGEKGVKGLIVVAGGFAESGPEGEALEKELVNIVRRYGMRLIGPNCIGVYDGVSGVDTFFIPRERMRRPPLGPIAVVSQSGAFLTTFMDFIATESVGVLRAVNFGNKADVDEVDVFFYLAGDREIRTIMMYLEDVRPRRGQLFMEALHMARANGKNVIVLKGGRTGSGARAARSHTAAVAGDYKVFSSALKQAGAVEVFNVYEFVDAAKAVTLAGGSKGREVIVLTNAGGPGVLSTDLLTSAGLAVPPLPEDIRAELRNMFPPRVAVGNPIDLTGDARDEDYVRVLEVLSKYDFGDIVFTVALLQPPTLTRNIHEALSKAYERLGKRMIVIIGGSPDGDYARAKLNEKGIPAYPLPSRGVTAARALYYAGKKPCRDMWKPVDRWIECRDTIKMSEYEALRLLEKYGFPLPKYCFAKNPEEAIGCFESIGSPVVAKIVSRSIVHKSDVGGVILGINTVEAMRNAFERLSSLGRSHGFDGVLVMEQVKGYAEVFAGARIDAAFGPVIVFGAGGVFVELYRDVSVRVAPLVECDAREMIRETRIGEAIARGYRGMPPREEDLVSILEKLSRLIMERKEIAEIDLNPIILGSNTAYVVDARINLCR